MHVHEWFKKSTNGRFIGALYRLLPDLGTRLAFRLFFGPRVGEPSAAGRRFLATGRQEVVDGVATWTWEPGTASASPGTASASPGTASASPGAGSSTSSSPATAFVVHGWNGRASQLRAVVEALRGRGFRVVAFDAPGHGNSPGKIGSIAHFVRALRTLAARGAPDVIVAHSLGAAATTVAIADGAVAPRRVVYYGPNVHPLGFLGKVLARLGADDSLAERFQAYTEAQLGRSFDSVDPRRVLAEMRAALLVIHAEDDREVSVREGLAYATGWAGARLVVPPTLGHRRILHDPALAGLAADFLAGSDAGRAPACTRCGVPTVGHDGRCETCALEWALAHRAA